MISSFNSGNQTLIIRAAKQDDLPALLQLRADSIGAITAGYDSDTLQQWLHFNPTDRYLETIRVRNLLVASNGDAILGCAGLYLPKTQLIATFVHPDCGGTGVGRRLVAAVEERARQFGLPQMLVESALNATPFYQSCGYFLNTATHTMYSQRTGLAVDALEKTLSCHFSDHQRRILGLLKDLGIPLDYGVAHMLPIQSEATELDDIGTDVFDRQQKMLPAAADAWQEMRRAALAEQVELLPVSAFRTIEYQAALVAQKISHGQAIADILRVSAAPGFSEHHSGRAIDIASTRENALEECFAATASFDWLSQNAGKYGFELSYPADNPHGIAYEPWHWAWRPMSGVRFI